MSIITYLIVLFLISCGYFRNVYTMYIFSNDTLFVLQWIWGIIGFIYYQNRIRNRLNTVQNRKFVYFFIGILFISALYPYFVFNQAWIDTFFSQRFNYSICSYLLFLCIVPNEKEIIKTIKICSLISCCIFVISCFNESLFLTPEALESRLAGREAGYSKDVGLAGFVPGFAFILLHFYLLLAKLKNYKFLKTDYFVFIILLTIVILAQNRQAILICAILTAYCILFQKRRHLKSKIGILLLTAGGVTALAIFLNDIFISLFEETKNQLSDSDYNRWQAIKFYVLGSENNLFTWLFGHCMPSLSGNYIKLIVKYNQEYGAMYQDIGWFGVFYLYGATFIGLSFYFLLRGLVRNKISVFLKLWCASYLIIPTYNSWGLGSMAQTTTFALLMYMVTLINYKQKRKCTSS